LESTGCKASREWVKPMISERAKQDSLAKEAGGTIDPRHAASNGRNKPAGKLPVFLSRSLAALDSVEKLVAWSTESVRIIAADLVKTPTQDSQKLSKRRSVIAGSALLLILILLVANALLLKRQLSIQFVKQDWVTRTRQVQFELESTESLIKDAETGERGFLYTGDEQYLAPYKLAVAQIDAHIDHLTELTADDPHQQEQIPTLRFLTHARLAELAQTISLYQSGKPDEANAVVKSGLGLVSMNNIRNLVGQIQQEQTSLETTRTTALQRSIRVTVAYIYLASFLAAVGMVFLAYFIRLEIDHRERYLDEIEKREEWYRVTIGSIGDAVICIDSRGRIVLLNLVAEELTGWPLAEAIGQPMDKVLRIVDATTRKAILDIAGRAADAGRTEHLLVNCVLIRRDGREIFVEDSVAPIHNSEGETTGSVIVFRDVTEARALAEKLIHSAQHDALTGLPNRTLLNDRVRQAIFLARRQKGQAAVLFLDLDGFKHINDTLGHHMGDQLLQSVAKRLQDCVRTPDTVSRQGGDEFVVLLQELHHAGDAAVAANRMLNAIAEAHTIGEHQIYVTGSVGISLYPDDGLDVETLFKNADTAMYQAKRNGRQSYQFFKPGINAYAEQRYSIEQGLRRALDHNEFTLHYQPKIDLKSGTITGAEALLRWTHPTRGMVPPEQFIPIAEESGLILPIGAWVLHDACKQVRKWLDAGLPCGTMAVNVSSVQFRNEEFLGSLFTELNDSGLNPQSLELEMTESVLMKNPGLTAPILKTLRESGVQVSVDDFGTGYSSLSYLQQFPLDALKIDQSFVRRLGKAPDDTAIVSAIISMGRSLHLRVIAEGVETLEDLAFLKTRECDEGQGYYFSYPMPSAPFTRMLETHLVN